MGIQGLLPQLKPIQNPTTLARYEGETLGIDGYAWLHRAACSCAYELVMGKPTDRYLQFFVKRFAMMKAFKVEPYLIFDGANISVKKGTELKRREKRVENKKIAERLWNSGERRNAMEYFQKCIDITPEMAKCVIDYCKNNRIKYIVAPFEADPQMVYLEQKGMIQGIISEDSDLLIFGCRRLITKLNEYGECIEICRDDFDHLPSKFPLGQLTYNDMRTMVCLSGCDYTFGIPKIGLLTAMKLIIKFKSMDKILLNIQREGKLKIPDDFTKEYEMANYAFQFQRVFCPLQKKIVTLNEIPDDNLNNKGRIAMAIGQVINKDTQIRQVVIEEEDIDHDLHEKICLGDLQPNDFSKPLTNREQFLQIVSKSENNLNNYSKSIDNFFNKKTLAPNEKELPIKRRTLAVVGTNKIDELIKRRKLNQQETNGTQKRIIISKHLQERKPLKPMVSNTLRKRSIVMTATNTTNKITKPIDTSISLKKNIRLSVSNINTEQNHQDEAPITKRSVSFLSQFVYKEK